MAASIVRVHDVESTVLVQGMAAQDVAGKRGI